MEESSFYNDQYEISFQHQEHIARMFHTNERLYSVFDSNIKYSFKLEPLELFRYKLLELVYRDENEKQLVTSMAQFLPFVEYRNPIAFLLGYRLFKKDQSVMDELEEYRKSSFVTIEMVIAYARWWSINITRT